jgi:hypothetical protein
MKRAMGLNIPFGWICSTPLSMTALIEIVRGGSRFTWTNKQNNPVRSVLDRVFASKEWEQKFPKVKLMTLTRVRYDHCPLLLDDGTRNDQIKRGFRFEIAWLSQKEFRRKLTKK